MKKKYIEEQANRLANIEKKYNDGQELTLREVLDFGLYQSMTKNIHELDDFFKAFKFREIYFRYFKDLSFRGSYFKRNISKKISDYIDLESLQDVNKKKV